MENARAPGETRETLVISRVSLRASQTIRDDVEARAQKISIPATDVWRQ
jgi:hypothetical protein